MRRCEKMWEGRGIKACESLKLQKCVEFQWKHNIDSHVRITTSLNQVECTLADCSQVGLSNWGRAPSTSCSHLACKSRWFAVKLFLLLGWSRLLCSFLTFGGDIELRTLRWSYYLSLRKQGKELQSWTSSCSFVHVRLSDHALSSFELDLRS